MRETKFRYVFENFEKEICSIEIVTIADLESGKYSWIHLKNQSLKVRSRDAFTGLKDKNGNEIYERDVIIYSVVGHQEPHKAVVEFKEGAFVENYYGWRLYPKGQEFMMEIIGNIHENPELLTPQA